MSFLASVRAEFAKILTTRMWWILALVLFGYIGLLGGGLGALFGGLSSGAIATDGPTPQFGSLAPLVYSLATSVGYVFPVLLGALATTGEFRHQTLTPTFLTTPRRGEVLGAKSLVFLIVGATYGIIGLIASVGIGAIFLSLFDVDTALGESDTWALVGRAILAMALWSAIGVGLGAMLRGQVAAIVTILVFTQFVEPLLRSLSSFIDWTGEVSKYLPGAAGDGLVGASFFTIASPTGSTLDWWQGGLVLLAYAVGFTVIGYVVTWRRDVT